MAALSFNDKDALIMVLSQIKDFKANQGRFRRGYITITNDEYHRLNEILTMIKADLDLLE